jgi:cytochrome b subunit of formate dehydrogenase
MNYGPHVLVLQFILIMSVAGWVMFWCCELFFPLNYMIGLLPIPLAIYFAVRAELAKYGLHGIRAIVAYLTLALLYKCHLVVKKEAFQSNAWEVSDDRYEAAVQMAERERAKTKPLP